MPEWGFPNSDVCHARPMKAFEPESRDRSGAAVSPERDARSLRGRDVLSRASLNKATAFTAEERDRLGLRGLLPARIGNQTLQISRVLENLRRKDSDIERYIFLTALQSRNERLFYRTLTENIEELLPIVYTPTVGEACRTFAQIFRQPRGFYISSEDRGHVRRMLDNWPDRDVRMVVMTDGQRILGLGDLGANGMGIPIGKLSLYTAFAGIPPEQCLPIQIDVGTDNPELLADPLYLGLQRERIVGEPYLELLDEIMEALHEAFPASLVQFEDFLTPNAYALLDRYRDRYLCFNDDIQGTAAMALAGLLASTRITRIPLREQRFLFLGAGAAATGIADLLVAELESQGLCTEEARRKLWFVDVDGLVTADRAELPSHNRPYAHPHEPLDFHGALDALQPHVLIGATGHGGAFDEAAIATMARHHERPVVFALSNPTHHAECTAQQAWDWSEGRVVFASGSPFPPVAAKDGELWMPAQGNNAYIFPGVGLGALGCGARTVTEGMFLAAARSLASAVSPDALAGGALYPSLAEIREVSLGIAMAVAEAADEAGVATRPPSAWTRESLARDMYDPVY